MWKSLWKHFLGRACKAPQPGQDSPSLMSEEATAGLLLSCGQDLTQWKATKPAALTSSLLYRR